MEIYQFWPSIWKRIVIIKCCFLSFVESHYQKNIHWSLSFISPETDFQRAMEPGVTLQCQKCGQYSTITEMYYCGACNKVLCGRKSCICEEPELPYCPVCFDIYPPSDATKNSFRYVLNCHWIDSSMITYSMCLDYIIWNRISEYFMSLIFILICLLICVFL